ncbi:hypothetical protein N7533_013695 [Penicillium manginii]|uniref:uncharacterized protein n=1 Tax=Penicillium manginii TaxID=203109 RepID=UPI0025477CD8|nr:uncharacterized protein N7533_013695 [Penicillium manginii]KAJ5733248.1 hypothetical protein N7533_013695 [Penicillium manginii]
MNFLSLTILTIASFAIASPTPSPATDITGEPGLEKGCDCRMLRVHNKRLQDAELACKERCRVFAGTPGAPISEAFCETGCSTAWDVV